MSYPEHGFVQARKLVEEGTAYQRFEHLDSIHDPTATEYIVYGVDGDNVRVTSLSLARQVSVLVQKAYTAGGRWVQADLRKALGL